MFAKFAILKMRIFFSNLEGTVLKWTNSSITNWGTGGLEQPTTIDFIEHNNLANTTKLDNPVITGRMLAYRLHATIWILITGFVFVNNFKCFFYYGFPLFLIMDTPYCVKKWDILILLHHFSNTFFNKHSVGRWVILTSVWTAGSYRCKEFTSAHQVIWCHIVMWLLLSRQRY